MSADEKSGAEPPAEEASARQSTPFLVLQFFVFPMAIVAVSVAVFVVFGLIASASVGAFDAVSTASTIPVTLNSEW